MNFIKKFILTPLLTTTITVLLSILLSILLNILLSTTNQAIANEKNFLQQWQDLLTSTNNSDYELKQKKLDFEISKQQLLNQNFKFLPSVNFNSSRRFFQKIDLKMQLDIQKQEVKFTKESLKIMRSRFKQGLKAEEEVLRLNVDLINSTIALEEIQRDVKNQIINFEKDHEYKVNLNSLSVFPPPNFNNDIVFPLYRKHAFTNSPEIKKSNFSLEKSKITEQRNFWGLLAPTLDAFYNYSNNGGSGAGQGPYSYDSSTGLTLAWNLFSNWDDISSYKTAKLQKEKNNWSHKDIKRKTEKTLLQFINRFNTLKKTIDLQKENVKLAEKFYKQTYQGFQLGLVSSNNMNLDQQRMTRAHQTLSRLLRDYYNLIVDLNFLTGDAINKAL